MHYLLTHYSWLWWIVNNVGFIRDPLMRVVYDCELRQLDNGYLYSGFKYFRRESGGAFTLAIPSFSMLHAEKSACNIEKLGMGLWTRSPPPLHRTQVCLPRNWLSPLLQGYPCSPPNTGCLPPIIRSKILKLVKPA